MSKDYGSATINGAPTAAIQAPNKGVQPPIGFNALPGNNPRMLNGHIGAALSQTVTPKAAAELIAADGTPAVGPTLSDAKQWNTTTGTWGNFVPPQPPTATVPPAVTGTAKVGSTLTSSTGTWNNATSYNFSWVEINGNNRTTIPGATSSTYVPVPGDVGKTLASIVQAIGPGGGSTRESNSVGPVVA